MILQEIVWRPELSKLSHLKYSSIQNSLELHFLIQADDYDGTPQTYLKGCPLEHHCNKLLSSRIETSLRTYLFLKDASAYVTSSFIPTTEMTLTSIHNDDSVKLTAIKQILSNCVDNPVRINGAIGQAAQIGMWAAKCVEFINGKSSKSMSSSKIIEKLFDSDSEMNDLSGYSSRESDVSKENVTILKHRLWLSASDTMIQNYNDYFAKQLREKICVGDEEFEKLHEGNLINAKKGVRWNDFLTKSLGDIFEQRSAEQKTFYWEANNMFYKEEERISEEAYQFAVKKFKCLLDETLSISTFLEDEFQTAYHRISTETLQLFLKSLKTQTIPWMVAYRHLEETLSSLQSGYMQQNQNQLLKIDQDREGAIKAGVQCYQDEMSSTLPATKLSKDKLESLSQTCCDVAMRKFHKEIGKNISRHILVTWEDEMKVAINEIKSSFVAKNEKLLSSPKHKVQLKPSVNGVGIGLYIDQQRVIIYAGQQNPSENDFSEYDHNIAIVGENILFGKKASAAKSTEHECKGENFWYSTVFGLLTDLNGFLWPINIAGKSVKVGQEEILALYFHKIRIEFERRIQQRISSCFVAITGLLTSGAKQILKTSLTFAGFETNTLIPFTTTMAISYSRKLHNEKVFKGRMPPNLLIYISSNLIEVAVANVSSDCVTIQNICGSYGGANGLDFEEKLEKILRDNFSIFECRNIIVINSGCQQNDFNMLSELVHDIIYPKCDISSLGIMDIIKVTALLDAVQKRAYSEVPHIPTYNLVHPYKISMKIKGRISVLSTFNNDKNVELRLNRCGDVHIIEFIETAKALKDQWIVGTYHLAYEHKMSNKTQIRIVLKKEGNFFIELNAQGQLLGSNVRSMTSIGFQDMVAVMKPMITESAQYLERKWSALDHPSNSYAATPSSTTSSNKIDSASEKLLEDLMKSVEILITKTKRELETSKLTPAAHRDNIESRINKCEALMKSAHIKVKQLEIDKSLLERAAKFIK